jgi:homoserine dehydrogenase
MKQIVIVVGLGEVGKALMEIVKSKHQTFGVDINLPASVSRCDIMHGSCPD